MGKKDTTFEPSLSGAYKKSKKATITSIANVALDEGEVVWSNKRAPPYVMNKFYI